MRIHILANQRTRAPLVDQTRKGAPRPLIVLVPPPEGRPRAHVKGHEDLEVVGLGGDGREVLQDVLPEGRRRLQCPMVPEQAEEDDEVVVHPAADVALADEVLGDGALVEEAHRSIRASQGELVGQEPIEYVVRRRYECVRNHVGDAWESGLGGDGRRSGQRRLEDTDCARHVYFYMATGSKEGAVHMATPRENSNV